ncbi:MAG: SMP-30/gluconolactonase/LRE family protein [Betaproteobacteria bacterium]|jgi:sugar lactone lactonase YvrE|nr:SMP-30/gluconolactonase/LRE family protein [Betaproteobacteria bacterium]NBZ98804.1 SMP-30/gluconolactonase/LRE family protein [Betaproteobacteria bacterium]NDB43557.1 SMP-30/gluconolactonase/LRE family protein [Betaproteobacteria bacterium]NDD22663.1 SMP-30/gluconolactonase/LRE family protein [Betaproteobacteria bacterium]NDF77993.1 SMP-30/gluconolactonase/LRE family protein [Betaproteobacteria bacterium]
MTTQADVLGESPFWHPQEQRLYWVDIPGRRLRRMKVSSDLSQSHAVDDWPLQEEPGCFAPAQQGGWVMALRSGVYRAHEWGGALHLLAPAPYDTNKLRFNDGKCDPAGNFWSGTMYEPRDQAAGVLYALQANHALQPKADQATVANGLAWSPNGKTLYWSDTGAHCIRAWDFEVTSQQMTRERVFAQFPAKPKDWTYGSGVAQTYAGRPDGAAVDAEGFYYAAMYEGHRLAKIAPDGRCVAFIETPVQCPTMPCFGGADLRTLFITTSAHGRTAAELQALPQSGCVFAMRVDTPGLLVSFFNN